MAEVPGMTVSFPGGEASSHPCFTGLKMYDTGFGFMLPDFHPLTELCALREYMRINPYLDVRELATYVVLWTVVWLFSQYILLRFVYKPLAYKFLPAKQPAADTKEAQGKSTATNITAQPRATSPPVPNGKSARQARPQPDRKLVHKFVTACSKFVNYTVAFTSCMYVLRHYHWWNNTSLWWIDFPHMIEPLAKHYNYFYLGFYVHQMVILFYEPKMKDFYVMVTHHIVTILLVLFSFSVGYYRIGLPIMAIHDLSDPFMEIAKVFFYCEVKVGNTPVADILFIVFAFAFFVSRLVIYPSHLLWTVLWEGPILCTHCMGNWPFFFLLATLQVMHAYWMFLILKMVVISIANKGVQGDVREDDDD